MVEIDDAALGLRRFEEHRSGAISKKHRRGAIEWVYNGAHQVGTHDDDSLMGTARDQLCTDREPV